MIEYEFVLLVDGEWAAGGSGYFLEELIDEAHHYKNEYSSDGSVEIKYYERKEIFV